VGVQGRQGPRKVGQGWEGVLAALDPALLAAPPELWLSRCSSSIPPPHTPTPTPRAPPTAHPPRSPLTGSGGARWRSRGNPKP
jgi:hypothetical protein